MTCVRDWFQIHQQALHTKLFTEAKACVPCYRWHGHAGPGPAQWGLASGAARTQWLITMPCTAVGPLRQHGGQVTTPLPQQLLLSLWQRKGQTLLFFLGLVPSRKQLHAAESPWQAGSTDPAAAWPWPFALGWGERRQPGDATTGRSLWC